MRGKTLAWIAIGILALFAAAFAVSKRMGGMMTTGVFGENPYAELTLPLAPDALPVYTEAMPEFSGIETWLNSDALRAEDLKGKVVLIDFWTYSCINCIRTLPYVTSWYEKYKEKGFVVIGVHTPEFAFEKEEKNVRSALARHGITYPVALDNAYGTWNNYSNRYWPAHYLFDAQGRLRQYHFGEGKYDETELAIQALLKEAGREAAMEITEAEAPDLGRVGSPETYLGYARISGYASPEKIAQDVVSTYTKPKNVGLNHIAFSGSWKIEAERAVSEDKASLTYVYSASAANLVLGGSGKRVEVRLDGRPVPEAFRGADTVLGADGKTFIKIDGERLYELTNGRGSYGEHVLELFFDDGVSAYAFTFG